MLKLLVDYAVSTEEAPGGRGKEDIVFFDLKPEKSTGSSRYFVLLSDGVPVVKATLVLRERDETPGKAILKRIDTDFRHRRKGYSARMIEMLSQWAHDRGFQLYSDWDRSDEHDAFWRKQAAKGRAVMTNPDDPSETAYRLVAPPGTTLDGVWSPWSPPWGRR